MERKTWLFVVWRRLSSIVYRIVSIHLSSLSVLFSLQFFENESIRVKISDFLRGAARGGEILVPLKTADIASN